MVHLPAVNTPQFDWCQTTMDRHPQPVPPIYQPEIPAKFIVQAALDGRRSKVVGSWNKLLVAAGQMAPGRGKPLRRPGRLGQPAGRPAARTATDPTTCATRPTTSKDAGAHGIFDGKAKGFFDPSFLKTLPNAGRTFFTRRGRQRPRPTPAIGRRPLIVPRPPSATPTSHLAPTGWQRAAAGPARPAIRLGHRCCSPRPGPCSDSSEGPISGCRAAAGSCVCSGPDTLFKPGRSGPSVAGPGRSASVVDLLHAATSVGFAVVDPRWRRAALSDTAVTTSFVVLGLTNR